MNGNARRVANKAAREENIAAAGDRRGSSRWDALKTYEPRDGRSATRQVGPNRRSNTGAVQPVHSNRNDVTSQKSDDYQALITRYRLLRDDCRSNEGTHGPKEGQQSRHDDPLKVSALAEFVARHRDILPAEETATAVVRDVFLPLLGTGVASNITNAIFDAISKLLENDKHASAMLAHLTEGVEETGTEHVAKNAIRVHLFAALQEMLPDSAACLTRALRAAHRVDGRSAIPARHLDNGVGSTSEISLSAVKDFLAKSLDDSIDEPPTLVAMNLLLALLRFMPQSAQSLVSVLLWESSPHSSACRHCPCGFTSEHDNTPSPFLQTLHSVRDPETLSVTMFCAAELLGSLPLHQWLPSSSSSTTRQLASTTINSQRRHCSPSSFQTLVANAVGRLTRIAICSRLDCQDAAYAAFAKSILVQVPYSINDDGRFTSSCTYGSMAVELVNQLSLSASGQKMMVDCLGGHVTPSGRLTETSIPVDAWLQSSRGSAFVEALLCRGMQPDAEKSNIRLIHAIVRGSPGTVLHRRTTWTKLLMFIESTVQNSPLLAAQTLERLLKGRFDFMQEPMTSSDVSESEFLAFTMPLLASLVSKEQSRPVQCAGCEGYANLGRGDWLCTSFHAEAHVKLLLSRCSPETPEDVAAAVCKAIGSVCSTYFESKSADALDSMLVSDTIHSLCHPLDRPGSVQCMALFAIGNLAQTLHRRSLNLGQQEARDICLVAEKSLALVSSANEKVIVNAIRVSAWLVCWVFRYRTQCETARRDCAFSAVTYLRHVVQALSDSIQSALLLCRDGVLLLTWKQHSKAKKQGWGACNALAVLFENHFASSSGCDENTWSIYKTAVSHLMDCVANLTRLHEKVALSTVAALVKLERSSFATLVASTGKVGMSLVSCVDFLFQDHHDRPLNEQMHREVGALLTLLLSCATPTHVREALQSHSFVSQLDRLFTWMVEADHPTAWFQSFCEALFHDSCQGGVLVHVQQQFADRAARNTEPHDDDESLPDEL
jgi:hypothetical protein